MSLRLDRTLRRFRSLSLELDGWRCDFSGHDPLHELLESIMFLTELSEFLLASLEVRV